jgi:hypothetical protein
MLTELIPEILDECFEMRAILNVGTLSRYLSAMDLNRSAPALQIGIAP